MLPLVAIVFGAVGLALAMTVVISGHGIRSARAQLAADAAALAEAAAPGTGPEVARANGARLVSVQRTVSAAAPIGGGPPGGGAPTWTGPVLVGPLVVIEVERSGVRARAAAAAFAMDGP